jgi:cytoskeletal protein CcmA (bactofilin family)
MFKNFFVRAKASKKSGNKIYIGNQLVAENLSGDIIIKIEGDLESLESTNVTVNGSIHGPLDGTNIKVTGNVTGDIDGTNITVGGGVNGSIDGTNITVGGSVSGDIDGTTISIKNR